MAQPFNIEDFLKNKKPAWEQGVPAPAPQPSASPEQMASLSMAARGVVQLPDGSFGRPEMMSQLSSPELPAPQQNYQFSPNPQAEAQARADQERQAYIAQREAQAPLVAREAARGPMETMHPIFEGIPAMGPAIEKGFENMATDNQRGTLPNILGVGGQVASQMVKDFGDVSSNVALNVGEWATGKDLYGGGMVDTAGLSTPQPESFVNPFTAPYPDGSVPTVPSTQTQPTTQPQAPQPQGSGLTTVGGAPLGEFLSGAAMPEQGFAREERPMAGRGETLSPDAWDQLGAQREARIGMGGQQARGPDSMDRQEGELSMEQATRLSGGDRDKARQMVELSRMGRDPMTGQPLQAESAEGMTPYQQATLAQRQQEINMKINEGMEKKEAARMVDYETSMNNVRATSDAYEKLKPVAQEIAVLSGSKFTEGGLGWVASKLPMSTDARQIERLTTEFEGSAFLQGLIEAKAKGATFGALSEREGDRILGQWGKITDPSSTNEQRISAINSMLSSIERSATRAIKDHKSKYQDIEDKKLQRGDPGFAQGGGSAPRYKNDQDVGGSIDDILLPKSTK